MRAGRLRRTATLQQRAETVDGFGQPSLTWSDVATVYADVRALSGRELLAAEAIKSEINVEIHLRYRADVTAQQRFLIGSTKYNIHAVLDQDGRRRQLVCLCSTGLNDGG